MQPSRATCTTFEAGNRGNISPLTTGMGFPQEARIADPLIGQSFDGLVINLQPVLSPDERMVNLELEMLLARRSLGETAFESGARFLGPIDQVRQDRRVVDTSLQIAPGGTYVIDLGVDPDQKGRRLAAEIHVALP